MKEEEKEETKPEETKPEETKPEETKPEEAKLEETQTETKKSAEDKLKKIEELTKKIREGNVTIGDLASFTAAAITQSLAETGKIAMEKITGKKGEYRGIAQALKARYDKIADGYRDAQKAKIEEYKSNIAEVISDCNDKAKELEDELNKGRNKLADDIEALVPIVRRMEMKKINKKAKKGIREAKLGQIKMFIRDLVGDPKLENLSEEELKSEYFSESQVPKDKVGFFKKIKILFDDARAKKEERIKAINTIKTKEIQKIQGTQETQEKKVRVRDIGNDMIENAKKKFQLDRIRTDIAELSVDIKVLDDKARRVDELSQGKAFLRGLFVRKHEGKKENRDTTREESSEMER